MISEKKDRLLGSSGSSKTKNRREGGKSSLFYEGVQNSLEDNNSRKETSAQGERDLHFECLSQSAAARMSHRRMVPLLLLYTNTLHWCG